MTPFLQGTFGNPSGGHSAARAAKTALEEAREEVAELLGVRPAEVVFTAGGTEADNLAVKGVARRARAGRRRRRRGHDGVRAQGRARVVRPARGRGLPGRGGLPVPESGVVDVDRLLAAVDERTVDRVGDAREQRGRHDPAARRGSCAGVRDRAPSAVVHTDAVQAVPWLDVARAAAGVDLVAISAHKFGGPKGTGALVVRNATALEPLIEGGGQEARAAVRHVERGRRGRDGHGAAGRRAMRAPPTSSASVPCATA